MFSRFCTKAVLCLIIVTLAIPSGLLLYPKKAEAQGNDCLIRIGSTLGITKLLSKVTGDVPVSNVPVSGSFVKDCIIEPLVTHLAKAMLYNITVSTVEWINSGFQGNPGFVKDFKGLMTDTADQVIGEFLEKEAAFLCSPFAFQVRVQLAQTYLPYRQRAACTLTDVVRNVEGFADSNNGYGWENWLEVTTVPQNNQYGAFVIAQDELSKRIFDAQYVDQTYLNWGRGFKDWMNCGEASDENGEVFCTRETPGAIVEGLLQKTFVDMPIDQLGLANNLNAILDALANQFTKQIVNGATGLLGGKKSPNENLSGGGGWSMDYDQAFRLNREDPTLTRVIDRSLQETGGDLSPFFTDPESGDGSAGTTSPGTGTETPTLGLEVTDMTQELRNGDEFLYQVELVSNYYKSGLAVKITLIRKESDQSFGSIFEIPFEVTYGRSDVGYKTTSYPSETEEDPGQISSILWQPIAVLKEGKYVFKITANLKEYDPATPVAGEYFLETVVTDSAGNVMDEKKSDFTLR